MADTANQQIPLSQVPWYRMPVPREEGFVYGSVLPFRKPVKGGKAEWSLEYSDLVKSFMDAFSAPGRALRGEEMDPRDALNVSLAMLAGNAPLPAKAGPGTLGMNVYHGSPHKFDKFDMSKVGTGEGAQAYGHGLYFAENRGVGEEYRNALNDWFPNGIKTKPGTAEDAAAAHVASAIDGQYQNPYAQAKEWIRNLGGPQADAKIAAINKWQKDGVQFKRGGSLYKVDIPDEQIARMLDWDKPLSQQPESVRKALADAWLAHPEAHAHMTGRDIYNQVAKQFEISDSAWNALGKTPHQKMNIYDAASERLKQLGIPGIQYLDGGSRGAGQGTRNFVVFDDSIPKILERE